MITVQDKTVTVQLLNQTGGQTHTSDIMVLLKDNNTNKSTFNNNEIVVKDGRVSIYKKSNIYPTVTSTYNMDNNISITISGGYYPFFNGTYIKQPNLNLWQKSTGEQISYTVITGKNTSYSWVIKSDKDDTYFSTIMDGTPDLPTIWNCDKPFVIDTPTDLTVKIKTEDIFYISKSTYNTNSCVIYNNKLYVNIYNGVTPYDRLPTNISFWLEIPSYISTTNSKVLTEGIYYLFNFKNGLNKINSASNTNLTFQPIIIPSYNPKYNKFNNLIIL